MTDRSRLHHARGTAEDIPGLLEAVGPDPRDPGWDTLSDLLWSQGTVHPASFAALPRLTELARRWPELDFSHIDEVWWPALTESEAEIEARAAAFRAEMAAIRDWSDTLVVSHWGFILAFTGVRVQNCQWRRCDPTEPGPAAVPWVIG